jgi:hypothetical protein
VKLTERTKIAQNLKGKKSDKNHGRKNGLKNAISWHQTAAKKLQIEKRMYIIQKDVRIRQV